MRWSSWSAPNPGLFVIFIINLDDRREAAPIRSEGRSKLRRSAGTLGDTIRVQKDLGRNGLQKIVIRGQVHYFLLSEIISCRNVG